MLSFTFVLPYYPKKVSHSFSLLSHFPLALAALLLPLRLNPLSARFTAFTLTSLSRTLHAQQRYVSAATCHLLGLCRCCLVVLNCDSSSSFCVCLPLIAVNVHVNESQTGNNLSCIFCL